MSYTMLRNPVKKICLDANSFEKAALDFIRDSCQGLRFDMSKAVNIDSDKLDFEEKALNMVRYHIIWRKMLTDCVLKMQYHSF